MSHREDYVSPIGSAFLHRLEQLADVRLSLPITSHRGAPVGPALVTAKKLFRSTLQPFINEVLRKQMMFNTDLLGWARTVYTDLRSVESATTAVRASLGLRVQKLEATVERLERQLQTLSTAPREAGPGVGDPSRN